MSIKIDFSFGVILSAIFIVLKVVGVIDWSWIWLLSPIWIEGIIVLLLLLIYFIIRKLHKKGWYLF